MSEFRSLNGLLAPLDPVLASADRRRLRALRASPDRWPHGTRSRYITGCHCFKCRVANTNYETERAAKQRAGWHARLVDTDRVIAHLKELSKAGVGYKSVAAAANVSHTSLAKIKAGKKTQLRADAEARILAVDQGAIADGALIDAAPTRRLIGKLVEGGYTRAWIAHQLGYSGQGLQFRFSTITALNASRVERLYRRIERGEISR
jgi:hypothetical protein